MRTHTSSHARIRAAAALRRLTLAGALAAAAALIPVTGAAALSGSQVKVGEPLGVESPAVAVDSSGTAYVAWANTEDLAGETNKVEYCVLPAGATACSHTGTLKPADSAQYVDRVQVLVDGSTVVVLADVYGAAGGKSGEYEPEQEWQSTDGGAIFTQVADGKSVANGVIDADTAPLSAVIVPGTSVLGYGWDTAGSSSPSFDAFPLESPPQCSVETCPADESFAELEPNSNPDQIGNAGGQFASQQGASPAVIGVFNTDFTNGPLGCTGAGTASFGTAFAYGSGFQSPTNSYDISPGSPDSAWMVPVTQADCDVEYPAVGGGPSGFGVLEDNLGTSQTIYHRFDETTHSFDTSPVMVANEFEIDPAVSQDGSGGVYATFLGGGDGGQVSLAYSYNGGTTWSGPATLDPSTEAGEVTSSVDANGQGWAIWLDNGSVYAQSFVAADSVSPPTPTTLTTSQTAGAASGASLTVPAGTVGETDHATLTGANVPYASGSVEYALYSSPGCTAASKVFHSSASVSGGIVGASAPVSAALPTGKYYWQASYSGNEGSIYGARGNQASASSCGAEALSVSTAVKSPILTPPKVSEAATSTGTTITVTISCASTPCTVTLTITVSGASTASVEGTAARTKKSKKSKKSKRITLGTATFTIRQKGPQKLTVHLTKAGRKLLAKHHGRLAATLHVSEKLDGHTLQTTKTIKIKPAKPSKRKK